MVIRVTPEELGKVANQLRTFATEYDALREKMYAEVTNLSSKWSGDDNIAFTSKIEAAIQSLASMSAALNQEAENLDAERINYQNRQQDIIDSLN